MTVIIVHLLFDNVLCKSRNIRMLLDTCQSNYRKRKTMLRGSISTSERLKKHVLTQFQMYKVCIMRRNLCLVGIFSRIIICVRFFYRVVHDLITICFQQTITQTRTRSTVILPSVFTTGAKKSTAINTAVRLPSKGYLRTLRCFRPCGKSPWCSCRREFSLAL